MWHFLSQRPWHFTSCPKHHGALPSRILHHFLSQPNDTPLLVPKGKGTSLSLLNAATSCPKLASGLQCCITSCPQRGTTSLSLSGHPPGRGFGTRNLNKDLNELRPPENQKPAHKTAFWDQKGGGGAKMVNGIYKLCRPHGRATDPRALPPQNNYVQTRERRCVCERVCERVGVCVFLQETASPVWKYSQLSSPKEKLIQRHLGCQQNPAPFYSFACFSIRDRAKGSHWVWADCLKRAR